MITSHSIDAVENINRRLNDSGRHLKAVDGTAVKALVTACISTKTYVSYTNGVADVLSVATIETDSRAQAPDGLYVHDETQDGIIDLAYNAVRGTLELARNKIQPMAHDVHKLYGEVMESYAVDASAPVTILPNVYHSVWGMPQLEGLVSRFRNSTLNPFRLGAGMPEIDGFELKNMLQTGIEALDEELLDWYDNLPADKVLETYRKVFVKREVTVGRATNALHEVEDSKLDRNDLLIIFLIANAYEDNMPNGIEVSLDTLRNYMARMREQAGRALCSELDRRDRDRAAKVLVYRVSTLPWQYANEGRRVIHVNNDTYVKFLDEGGSPECLFGAVLRGASTTYASLMAEREVNEKTYARFLGIHNQRVAAEVYTSQRDAARVAMARYVASLPEADLPAPVLQLQQRTQQLLGLLQPRHFENELVVIRNLVCDVLYPQTNARMFFEAMDAAERANPDMSPRECALEAELDLIARWLASQIEVCYD